MEQKDKRVDPMTEYDSESESEKRCTASIDNWSNSSNEESGWWRTGGPLMDPKKKQSKLETRECINCREQTTVWHAGERFDCDRNYADDLKQLAAHNKLCRACAISEDRCSRCPYHVCCFYKCEVDEDEVPEVVWTSEK